MSIYEYSVPKTDGTELSLKDFEGKVMLIVNTATGCGFTPQYKPLEEMYEKYHEKGLEIIDIPCNQFMGQAPGTDEQIHEFCTLKYNTKFPQMKKSDVNGENALPLYGYLKEQQGFKGFGLSVKGIAMKSLVKRLYTNEFLKSNEIKWNFTKFLVDRQGNVVARFEPHVEMEKVEAAVAALL